MINFSESERTCEALFLSKGPFWHLYTPGVDTPLIFSTVDDFKFMMNLQAKCYYQHPGLKLYSFSDMGNHIHHVQSGTKDEVLSCFDSIRKGLIRYFVPQGKSHLLENFVPTVKPIVDLKQLRNNIVYSHRNGFVVDRSHTPFSYPWSTGRYYFNPFPLEHKFSEVSYRDAREMFCSRHPGLPSDYQMIDGYIAPTSYCDITTGMSFFRDAHQYFSMLSKNVEAYSELALEFGENVILTDNELYGHTSKLSREVYGVKQIADLNRSQVAELAKTMHYDFHASNEQIRRILSLSIADVNSLFPLSSK